MCVAFTGAAAVNATLIPDARFGEVAAGIIEHANERLSGGGLFDSNVPPTIARANLFGRLLSEYKKAGTITVSGDDRLTIGEAYGLATHLLKSVGGEILAGRLGWDKAGIERLKSQRDVLGPIIRHLDAQELGHSNPITPEVARNQDTLERIKAAWHGIVGWNESVPVAIVDKCLVIGVPSSATSHDLAFLEARIMASVQAIAPDVERLRFRHPPQAQVPRRGIQR